MTVLKAVATTLGFSLLFALIGTTAGWVVGTLAPEYYRSVCRGGQELWFKPVSVGIGFGLTQGLAGGFIAGLVVVALLCWREIRLRLFATPALANAVPGQSVFVARRILLFASSILVLGFCTTSGLVVGLLGGERGAYYRRFLEEKELIAPLLAADPAFAQVKLVEYSGGGALLVGKVPAAEDLGRLRTVLEKAVGESWARTMMGGVVVVKY